MKHFSLKFSLSLSVAALTCSIVFDFIIIKKFQNFKFQLPLNARKKRMNAELILTTHKLERWDKGRKFRRYVRRNEMEQRSSAGVDVFHFTLSTPHFLEIGATFDFDTRTALKQIEMFLLAHQFMHAAESLPQRQWDHLVCLAFFSFFFSNTQLEKDVPNKVPHSARSVSLPLWYHPGQLFLSD